MPTRVGILRFNNWALAEDYKPEKLPGINGFVQRVQASGSGTLTRVGSHEGQAAPVRQSFGPFRAEKAVPQLVRQRTRRDGTVESGPKRLGTTNFESRLSPATQPKEVNMPNKLVVTTTQALAWRDTNLAQENV